LAKRNSLSWQRAVPVRKLRNRIPRKLEPEHQAVGIFPLKPFHALLRMASVGFCLWNLGSVYNVWVGLQAT